MSPVTHGAFSSIVYSECARSQSYMAKQRRLFVRRPALRAGFLRRRPGPRSSCNNKNKSNHITSFNATITTPPRDPRPPAGPRRRRRANVRARTRAPSTPPPRHSTKTHTYHSSSSSCCSFRSASASASSSAIRRFSCSSSRRSLSVKDAHLSISACSASFRAFSLSSK